jgi:hypothetical protein
MSSPLSHPVTDCADSKPCLDSIAHPSSWTARDESSDYQLSVWHLAAGLNRQQGQRVTYEPPLEGYDEKAY